MATTSRLVPSQFGSVASCSGAALLWQPLTNQKQPTKGPILLRAPRASPPGLGWCAPRVSVQSTVRLCHLPSLCLENAGRQPAPSPPWGKDSILGDFSESVEIFFPPLHTESRRLCTPFTRDPDPEPSSEALRGRHLAEWIGKVDFSFLFAHFGSIGDSSAPNTCLSRD